MKKKLLIIIAMMLLVVGCSNDAKMDKTKEDNTLKETVTDTDKKEDNTVTNEEDNIVAEQPTNEVVDNEQTPAQAPAQTPTQATTPTCTPKKFEGTYSYAYATMEECKREGNILFMDITEDGNSDIFSYGCREIVDECGTTYYGVFFYNAPDSEVYR